LSEKTAQTGQDHWPEKALVGAATRFVGYGSATTFN